MIKSKPVVSRTDDEEVKEYTSSRQISGGMHRKTQSKFSQRFNMMSSS